MKNETNHRLKNSLPIILLLLVATNASYAADTVRVLMKTSSGNIQLDLNQERAPISVENFVKYTKDGFYDGTVFHRVIKGFMIQGGGFTASMDKKKPEKPIQNEAKNGLKNVRGSIAMARTKAPHSATAQFFINHENNTNLDFPSFDNWGYAVFGKVVEGMDVVDSIANENTGTQAGMANVPNPPIIIQSVQICPENDCKALLSESK